MPGPPPKPTSLKLLEGTFRPDRSNPNEPKPDASSMTPPSWLVAAERKYWDEKAPDLLAKGVLTTWDRDSLGRYCVLMNQFVKAKRKLAKNPAWIKEVRDLNVQLSRLEKEFGLTPVSRTRVSATPAKEPETKLDKFRRKRA